MKRTLVLLAVSVALLAFVGSAGLASIGIRSVGLRLILPFTGVPLYLGGEVVTEAPFGDLSFSLFLSPRGGTLLLAGADVALSSAPDSASAFLRLTTGLAYFDSTRLLPTLLLGAGTSVRFMAAEPLAVGLSAELIYPLALRTPLLSVSTGWTLP